MDQLTINFLNDLEKKSKSIISPTALPEVAKPPETKLPEIQTSTGASLWETLAVGKQPAWVHDSEKKGGMFNAIGQGVWHFLDTATFGLAGLALPEEAEEKIGIQKWDEMTTGAKVATVFGEAAGFLIPMGWISKGVAKSVSLASKSGGAKAVKGSIKAAQEMARDTSLHAATAASTVEKTLKTVPMKQQLARYSISAKGMVEAESIVAKNIGGALTKAFPTAPRGSIDEITTAVTSRLSRENHHVNSVGHWLQKSLNTKFDLATSTKLSKYIGHATEMSINFSLYNLLSDAVQTMAGEKDFDPVSDVGHALLFSTFLPIVQGIGGGGKIHIRNTRKHLSKMMNVFKNTNYRNYDAEQLKGFLAMIAEDTYLSSTTAGGIAARNWHKPLTKTWGHGQLAEVLDKIKVQENLDGMWGEFIKAAGSDLALSSGRMFAGALFFNAATLIDQDMLRNVEPEVLGAHLLVGAMFTKMRSPVFQKDYKTLSKFDRKLQLLRHLGVDGDAARAWGQYLESHKTAGLVFSGIVNHKEAGEIYNVIYDKEGVDDKGNVFSIHERQTKEGEGERIGENINSGDYQIVLYAKEIADMKQMSLEVTEQTPNQVIDLRRLTYDQIAAIKTKLEQVEIAKGVKLTADNAERYIKKVKVDLLDSGARIKVAALFTIADKLGLQVHGEPSEWSLDKPNIEMSEIEGWENLKEEHGAIGEFSKLIKMFIDQGWIRKIEQESPLRYNDIQKSKDSAELERFTKEELSNMAESLKKESFEGFEIDISPTDNAWLDLMKSYNRTNALFTMEDIIEGKDVTDRELNALRVTFREVFGDELPHDPLKIAELIRIEKPRTYEEVEGELSKRADAEVKEQEWIDIKGTREYKEILLGLQRLANIWGAKHKGDVTSLKPISYAKAKEIVGSFKSGRLQQVIKEGFDETFRTYFERRRWHDLKLTSTETGIIGILVANNAAWRGPNGEVYIPNEKEALTILTDERIGEGWTKEQAEEKMEQWRRVRIELGRVIKDGRLVKEKQEVVLSGPNRGVGVFGNSITEAYQLTKFRYNELIKDFGEVINNSQLNQDVLSNARIIRTMLMAPDGVSMKELTIEEARKISEKIEKDILNQLNKDEVLKDPEVIQLFTVLRNLLNKFDSSVEMSKTAIMSHLDTMMEQFEGVEGLGIIDQRQLSISRLTQAINGIIYRTGLTSHSLRTMGERKEGLINELVNILKSEGIEVPDHTPLGEIFSKFNFDPKSKLNVDNMTDVLNMKRIAWEYQFTQDEYANFVKEIQENKDMNDSPHLETPRTTFQSIETQYGKWNPTEIGDGPELFTSSNRWDELKINLKSFADGTYSGADANVETTANEILRRVYKAISTKHTDKEGKLNLAAFEAEKLEFNKRFPFILAQQYGNSIVKVISLSESSDAGLKLGNSLEVTERVTGDGSMNQFFHEAESRGVELYKVGVKAIYGNKTYNNYNDVNIDSAIMNDLWANPTRVMPVGAQGTGEYVSGFSGVKATVSYKDQIYIRTDNVKDTNAFKSWFTEWYNNMINSRELRDDNTTRRRFESMYGKFFRMESIRDPNAIREIVKAMYWQNLSHKGFLALVAASKSSSEVSQAGKDLMKYFNTMAVTGPMVRGSERFLKVMQKVADNKDNQVLHPFYTNRPGAFWGQPNRIHNPTFMDYWKQVSNSINEYVRNEGFNVVSLADESTTGLMANSVVRKELDQILADFGPNSENYISARASLDQLDKTIGNKFRSLDSSGVNAQSYLSERAAHITFLERGRNLYDDAAGNKPVGTSSSLDVLMKTQFVYDHEVANLLKKLERDHGIRIDVLSMESATKRFGAEFTRLQTAPNTDLVPADYRSFGEALGLTLSQSIRPENILKMKIEDFYFGKSTDRKLASVSYGILNFLNKAGYDAHTQEYIGYFSEMKEQLGDMLVMRGDSTKRNAIFQSYLVNSREDGDILDDGAFGAAERLAMSGLDVHSLALSGSADRLVVKRILGNISKPKARHGSYATLVPYLEGGIPLYGQVEMAPGVFRDRILRFGGKKLPHADGQIDVNDWGEMMFIIEHNQGKDQNQKIKGTEDIQVKLVPGKKDTDPWDIITVAKNGKEHTNSALRKEIKARLNAIKGDLTSGGRVPNLRAVHDRLMEMNASRSSWGAQKLNLYLHSVTLRIPNIGGDSAIHRVEGFWEAINGNMVGVNPWDLAIVHQADFDVDAATSHHNLHLETVKSIFEGVAMTPDAYIYPSNNVNINPFNINYNETGQPIQIDNKDSMEDHYSRYHNSQRVFGALMNVAPFLGQMSRLKLGVNGVDKLDLIEDMHGINPKTEHSQKVKQRLKNALQSIIDATKETNFASQAGSEEILKWVLFGDKPHLADSKIKSDDWKHYFEKESVSDWRGIFNFDGAVRDTELPHITENSVEYLKDSVIASMNILNMSNRILSGVSDHMGRRPPDYNQIIFIKNALERFFQDPNREVLKRLLFKYKRSPQKRLELMKLFFHRFEGVNDYNSEVALLKAIYSKKGQLPATERIIDIPPEIVTEAEGHQAAGYGKRKIHQSVGGIIADMFGHVLEDPYSRVKVGEAAEHKKYLDLMDQIDMVYLIGGEKAATDMEEFKKLTEVDDFWSIGEPGKLLFPDVNNLNSNSNLRDYSILYHVLERDEISLRKFIRGHRPNRGSSASVDGAEYKLQVVRRIKDHLESKESEILNEMFTDEKLPEKIKKFFDPVTIPTSAKFGKMYYNRERNYSYVYKITSVSAGKNKFRFVGSVLPKQAGGRRWLPKGGTYVILKKPLRYEMANQREVADAYALLSVTGSSNAQNIHSLERNYAENFRTGVSLLKQNFRELASGTYKMSKKSAFAQRNWQFAKAVEDNEFGAFMGKWLEQTDRSPQAIFDIISNIIRPDPTSGMVRVNKSFTVLPNFKINRRLLLAAERWLWRTGEKDVYNSIFREYGRSYRASVNKIPHPSHEAMYTTDPSTAYHGTDRNPLMDFVFDKGFLYVPHVLQRYRDQIRPYGGKTIRRKDVYGDTELILNYESAFNNMESIVSWYNAGKYHDESLKPVCT